MVLRARAGAAALALIERDRPDLLLTDNVMPRPGGAELIARLRARPGLAVPVIAMSAVMPVPMPEPPTAFIRKHFDIDDVLATAGAMLRQTAHPPHSDAPGTWVPALPADGCRST